VAVVCGSRVCGRIVFTVDRQLRTDDDDDDSRLTIDCPIDGWRLMADD